MFVDFETLMDFFRNYRVYRLFVFKFIFFIILFMFFLMKGFYLLCVLIKIDLLSIIECVILKVVFFFKDKR